MDEITEGFGNGQRGTIMEEEHVLLLTERSGLNGADAACHQDEMVPFQPCCVNTV